MTDKIFKTIIDKYVKRIKIKPTINKPILKKLRAIKIVFFDVYGTLLISDNKLDEDFVKIDRNILINLNKMIAEYDIRYKPGELFERFKKEIKESNINSKTNDIPYPEVDIIEIWKSILGTKDTFLLKKIALEFEMILHRVYPVPYFFNLLNYLNKKKIKIGIISNAQFYTEIILEYFLKKKLNESGFDPGLILYSYIYGIAKPSGRLFEQALEKANKLRINAENILFLGNDLVNDIGPAKKIGFRTVLYRDRELEVDNNDIQPDIIITNWKQIKKII